MKFVDRVLQRWRMRIAAKYLPTDVRLIDIGAHDGELFEYLGTRLSQGFGIEPLASAPRNAPLYTLSPGYFPAVRPTGKEWDAITLLAVLEHVPRSEQGRLAAACWDHLVPRGRVVITVPSRAVDHILKLLKALRLIDGMSLEEHYGFMPSATETIFAEPAFRKVCHRRFQCGLNHVFVFEKTEKTQRSGTATGSIVTSAVDQGC